MKPIFAHFSKIELSVIFWRLTKNSRNWFIFHAKIDQNCIFFGAKNPKRKSQFASIFLYKKCTLYKIPGMSPFFAPLPNETPFPNLQPRWECPRVQKSKKSPGFPPSFSSQMSLWAAEGKSGVARGAPSSPRSLLLAMSATQMWSVAFWGPERRVESPAPTPLV